MTYVSFHDFYDLVAAELGATQGVRLKLLIFLYRVASYGVFKQGAYRVLTLPFYILYRLYAEFLLGIELPVQVIAGRGLAIFHGQGLVVHKDTKIGARCILRQGVTIGNKRLRDGTSSGSPVIGDDVEFGAGSVAIGAIRIGSRVTIGACTVITKDVLDDSTVVGAAPRFIHETEIRSWRS
jgi:putative colanic acid biosynthesis acetyltransferase WcaB